MQLVKPPDSVLEWVLFNIFINDLESGVSNGLAAFADNTELFRVLKTIRVTKSSMRTSAH